MVIFNDKRALGYVQQVTQGLLLRGMEWGLERKEDCIL